MKRDPTCMSYWFPKLQATGVPVPQTHIIELERGLSLDSEDPEHSSSSEFLKQLYADIDACATSLGGYPVFLRTGHTSGKHQWKGTCFLQGKGNIESHVYRLWEHSECASIIGLPTCVWVVREMLKTQSPFTAFGGFPVTKERRYFIKDGEICGHHPYWVPEAVKDNTRFVCWEEALDKLNFQSASEMIELRALTQRVAMGFDGGAWSVDWLWTEDRGWVCIDMAEAHKSFIWREHPTAPKCAFEGERL